MYYYCPLTWNVTDWKISRDFERIFGEKLICHPWGDSKFQRNSGPSGEITAPSCSSTSNYPETPTVTSKNAPRTTQPALGRFKNRWGDSKIVGAIQSRPWGDSKSALGRFKLTKIRRRYEIQDGGNTSMQPI